MTRILVSNDDGYHAPGIEALYEAVKDLGDVVVMAPEQNCSGASNSLTLGRPVGVRQSSNGFYSVSGTPTDCVHLAATGFFDVKPDIVISGINNGQNMGDDTLYSGTVAAAMEGLMLGVPSAAQVATTAGMPPSMQSRMANRSMLTGRPPGAARPAARASARSPRAGGRRWRRDRPRARAGSPAG